LLKEKVARLTIVASQTLSAQMMLTIIITIKDSGVQKEKTNVEYPH